MAIAATTERIGIFGGTFDPPHIAHLVMAEEVRDALGLARVLMGVAGAPWQKVGEVDLSPAEDRLAMTEAAVRGIAGLEACDLEVRRGGPSYMVDTLAELAALHPGAELFLVLGADAAAGLDTWERAGELGDRATIVVVDRPGVVAPVPPGWDVRRVEAPRLDISSTDLRDRLARGRTVRLLVPDAVRAVIEARSLYSGGG